MQRYLFLLYGIVCHLMFLGVFLYFAAFVGNLPVVPKTIDSGEPGPVGFALAINLGLIALFGVQHSVMARPWFKDVWTRIIPRPIERSTYVLASNMMVVLLVWLWQPLPGEIWRIESGFGHALMTALFFAGWLSVPLVSLLINHFDLFGTRQVWLHFQGKPYEPLPFRAPLAYKWVRHPLYIGWMLAFWATPVMSLGHLLFALLLTGYMVVATVWEERDLATHLGHPYQQYQKTVGRFIPRWKTATGKVAVAGAPSFAVKK